MNATPYYLRPEDTELPEGHDDSLDPPEPPTDAAARQRPPFVWPLVDTSRGGTAPPDAALAPPATDPARRSVPASTWPTGRPRFVQNRALGELSVPEPDLDPDIELWPRNIVNRWPFTGPPTVGIWPKGWVGVDNTATLFVCTVGGQPGTWQAVASTPWGLAANAAFVGSGPPLGVVTPSAKGDLYIDNTTPGLWQATGTSNSSWARVGIVGNSSTQMVPPTPFTVPTVTAGVFLSLGPLAAGTWQVSLSGVALVAPTRYVDIEALPSVGGVVGATTTELQNLNGVSNLSAPFSLSFLATLPSSGNVNFSCLSPNTGSAILSLGVATSAFAGVATGATAVQVQ